MFGLGGGLIFTPLFVHIGYSPLQASSSSTIINLFSSMIACAQYGLIGSIEYDYAFWNAMFAAVGVLVGVTLIKRLIRITGRESILVFLLIGIFSVCVITIVIKMYGSILSDNANYELMLHVGSFCPCKCTS